MPATIGMYAAKIDRRVIVSSNILTTNAAMNAVPRFTSSHQTRFLKLYRHGWSAFPRASAEHLLDARSPLH